MQCNLGNREEIRVRILLDTGATGIAFVNKKWRATYVRFCRSCSLNWLNPNQSKGSMIGRPTLLHT